jgi:hypothetical protein
MKPYLLLQCRLPDDPMRDHERDCVLRALDCSPAALRRVNLSERLPSDAEIADSSAIMIGGSGAFHVYDEATWVALRSSMIQTARNLAPTSSNSPPRGAPTRCFAAFLTVLMRNLAMLTAPPVCRKAGSI